MPLLGQSPVSMKPVSQGRFLTRTMLKYNVIFNEGSRGESAYILTRGKIEISGTVDGRKKVFAILNPVSIFGEMALFLEDQTRTATAIALEDSEVVVFSRDDLEEYMKSAPQVISSIITVLVTRLKTATQKSLRVPSVPMGIIRILDLLADNGTREVRLERTVRTIAETLVADEKTVTGYLYGMHNEGFISIGKNSKDHKVIRFNYPDLLNQVIKARKKS